jgi:hypothetical protein
MPCESTVRVWENAAGVEVRAKLLCKGKCNSFEDKDCAPTSVGIGGVNITQEFCGCDGGKGDEPEDCHIILERVKEPKSFKHSCSSKGCADGMTCTEVPKVTTTVPFPDKDGKHRGRVGKRIDYVCECKPAKK